MFLLYVPKAINGYCVIWLGNIFILLPHMAPMTSTPGHRLFKNQLTPHALPYLQARWSQRF